MVYRRRAWRGRILRWKPNVDAGRTLALDSIDPAGGYPCRPNGSSFADIADPLDETPFAQLATDVPNGLQGNGFGSGDNHVINRHKSPVAVPKAVEMRE